MKSVLSGVVTVSTMLSGAYGATVCKNAAIRVARQYANKANVVSSVAVLPSKPEVESYRVALIDSHDDRSEVIDVTLNKSDSSVISVKPYIS